MKKLYPIFVNYNSGDQLYQGVIAVLQSPVVTGIIIVDNASNDTSLESLQKIKQRDKLIIIKNKKNLGFYAALNQAVKKAFALSADAVMPLDFDLNFNFDFISRLARVDADIVAPVLKWKKDGQWVYQYAGRINYLMGSQTQILKRKPIKNIEVLSATTKKNSPYWFDFVSGGCTIIKKKVIETIGSFDEDFFVYWGDADFALRARDAGLRVMVDANTIVHHYYDNARETGNFRKLKLSFFDQLTFIRKRIKWYYKIFSYLHIFYFSLKIGFITLRNRIKNY